MTGDQWRDELLEKVDINKYVSMPTNDLITKIYEAWKMSVDLPENDLIALNKAKDWAAVLVATSMALHFKLTLCEYELYKRL